MCPNVRLKGDVGIGKPTVSDSVGPNCATPPAPRKSPAWQPGALPSTAEPSSQRVVFQRRSLTPAPGWGSGLAGVKLRRPARPIDQRLTRLVPRDLLAAC